MSNTHTLRDPVPAAAPRLRWPFSMPATMIAASVAT